MTTPKRFRCASLDDDLKLSKVSMFSIEVSASGVVFGHAMFRTRKPHNHKAYEAKSATLNHSSERRGRLWVIRRFRPTTADPSSPASGDVMRLNPEHQSEVILFGSQHAESTLNGFPIEYDPRLFQMASNIHATITDPMK